MHNEIHVVSLAIRDNKNSKIWGSGSWPVSQKFILATITNSIWYVLYH